MLDGLMRMLAYLLVPMFAIGMIGSTVVVAITFVHDVVEFFDDEPTPGGETNVLHR